jgi:hypothetical protein
MHLHYPLTVTQILWTLTFAAQLVLLVVLLGRERARRFPLFTAFIALYALRLLSEEMLTGRLAIPILRVVFISLAVLSALLGLLVLMELSRRAFAGIKRPFRLRWTFAVVLLAAVVLKFWGPWPAAADLAVNVPLGILRLFQFLAQKTDLLTDLLTIQIGLLIVLFGRRFHAGWRTHPQAIAIGLSMVAISWVSIQAVWQVIARTVHPNSRLEYERLLAMGDKLVNANKVIYIIALLWWILFLWLDEPTSQSALTTDQQSELPGTETSAPSMPEL